MFAEKKDRRLWAVVLIVCVMTIKASLCFAGNGAQISRISSANLFWTVGAINETSDGTPLTIGVERLRSRNYSLFFRAGGSDGGCVPDEAKLNIFYGMESPRGGRTSVYTWQRAFTPPNTVSRK